METTELELICKDPDSSLKYYVVGGWKHDYAKTSPFDMIWIVGQTKEGRPINSIHFQLPYKDKLSMEAMNEAWPPKPCQECHPGPCGYMKKGMTLHGTGMRKTPDLV